MLPALAKARRGEPIRVWSAGCATGQEAYSLAMIVDEERPALAGAPVEIFGSDLSERARWRRRRRASTPSSRSSAACRSACWCKHFERRDEMWALSPRMRPMVRWRRVNLNADFARLGRFDVIFCRNVRRP